MSAQVYSVPGQTEGRRKAFLDWKTIDLSHKRSLTCVGNVNYHKSVNHPIPTTRANMKRPGNFQNKSVSSPFSWLFRYTLLVQTEWEKKAFFEGCKKRGHIVWLLPRALSAPPPLFLGGRFVDRFQNISKVKNPAISKRKV